MWRRGEELNFIDNLHFHSLFDPRCALRIAGNVHSLFLHSENGLMSDDNLVLDVSWKGEDPRAVVNWFIQRASEEKHSFPHVSLQKILYISHAASLHQFGRPLVRSAFEAWEFGPVNRSIWNELKVFGRSPITTQIEHTDRWTGEVSVIMPTRDERIARLLEAVYKAVRFCSPGELIEVTHKPGSAWHCIWNRGGTSVTLDNYIGDAISRERFLAMGIQLGQDRNDRIFFETPPQRPKD